MKTVLVVDDEKLIRWSLCQGLHKDFIVCAAGSAEEALNLLGRLPVDAVVTDLRMPGMSGEQFIAEIRKRAPELPVIAISAYANDAVIRHLRSLGVTECLPKPFQVSDVRQGLLRLLGEEAPGPRSCALA
jgi:two-component system response regulator AtoC